VRSPSIRISVAPVVSTVRSGPSPGCHELAVAGAIPAVVSGVRVPLDDEGSLARLGIREPLAQLADALRVPVGAVGLDASGRVVADEVVRDEVSIRSTSPVSYASTNARLMRDATSLRDRVVATSDHRGADDPER
jgi:hypothetical protein